MIIQVDPSEVAWEFEGAFTIVFDEEALKKAKVDPSLLLAYSKEFSERGMYVSCAHQLVQGIKKCDPHAEGILIKKVETYFTCDYVISVVTADGEILWERKS